MSRDQEKTRSGNLRREKSGLVFYFKEGFELPAAQIPQPETALSHPHSTVLRWGLSAKRKMLGEPVFKQSFFISWVTLTASANFSLAEFGIYQKLITQLICRIFNYDRAGIRHDHRLSKVCIINYWAVP